MPLCSHRDCDQVRWGWGDPCGTQAPKDGRGFPKPDDAPERGPPPSSNPGALPTPCSDFLLFRQASGQESVACFVRRVKTVANRGLGDMRLSDPQAELPDLLQAGPHTRDKAQPQPLEECWEGLQGAKEKNVTQSRGASGLVPAHWGHRDCTQAFPSAAVPLGVPTPLRALRTHNPPARSPKSWSGQCGVVSFRECSGLVGTGEREGNCTRTEERAWGGAPHVLGAPGQLSSDSGMNVHGNGVRQTPTSNQPLDLHQEISRLARAAMYTFV